MPPNVTMGTLTSGPPHGVAAEPGQPAPHRSAQSLAPHAATSRPIRPDTARPLPTHLPHAVTQPTCPAAALSPACSLAALDCPASHRPGHSPHPAAQPTCPPGHCPSHAQSLAAPRPPGPPARPLPVPCPLTCRARPTSPPAARPTACLPPTRVPRSTARPAASPATPTHQAHLPDRPLPCHTPATALTCRMAGQAEWGPEGRSGRRAERSGWRRQPGRWAGRAGTLGTLRGPRASSLVHPFLPAQRPLPPSSHTSPHRRQLFLS